MLSPKLKVRLLNLAQSIESDKEKFVSLVKEVAVELGGPHWASGDFIALWKQVTSECRAVLVKEGGMRPETFRYYIGAARKCLVFSVPFQFAVRVPIEDLARVKEIKDADKTDAAPEIKLRDAVRHMREEKAKLLPVNPLSNPTINELRSLLSIRVVADKLDRDPKMMCAVKSLIAKLHTLTEEEPALV